MSFIGTYSLRRSEFGGFNWVECLAADSSINYIIRRRLESNNPHIRELGVELGVLDEELFIKE